MKPRHFFLHLSDSPSQWDVVFLNPHPSFLEYSSLDTLISAYTLLGRQYLLFTHPITGKNYFTLDQKDLETFKQEIKESL